MFNPDMPQPLPKEEMTPLPTEKAPMQADNTMVSASKTEEAPEPLTDFAKRPENMLPRAEESFPGEEGMETLAGQWAEQMDAMWQAELREAFQQVVNSQRAMIREELFRNEITIGGSSEKNDEEGGFSQDQVAAGKSGASEWILEKLSHIPGGKRFLGALALVVACAAIPKDAEAENGRNTRWLQNTVLDMGRQMIGGQVREAEAARNRKANQKAEDEREVRRNEEKMEQATREYFRNLGNFIVKYDNELSKMDGDFNAKLERMENDHASQLVRLLEKNGDESTKIGIKEIIQKKYDDQIARLKTLHYENKLRFIRGVLDVAGVSEKAAAYVGKLGISDDAIVSNRSFLERARADANEVGGELARLKGKLSPSTADVSPQKGIEQHPAQVPVKEIPRKDNGGFHADYSLIGK